MESPEFATENDQEEPVEFPTDDVNNDKDDDVDDSEEIYRNFQAAVERLEDEEDSSDDSNSDPFDDDASSDFSGDAQESDAVPLSGDAFQDAYRLGASNLPEKMQYDYYQSLILRLSDYPWFVVECILSFLVDQQLLDIYICAKNSTSGKVIKATALTNIARFKATIKGKFGFQKDMNLRLWFRGKNLNNDTLCLADYAINNGAVIKYSCPRSHSLNYAGWGDVTVVVIGCGLPFLNGIYRRYAQRNGVPKYRFINITDGSIYEIAREMEQGTNKVKWWLYRTGTPEIDYYYCSRSGDMPPLLGWVPKYRVGVYPAPRMQLSDPLDTS